MTMEEETSFRNEKDMQLELVTKIVTIFEELLHSLNWVGKV